uniref:Uncharacterized protein n=1 Tax=Knipowitschia caucasica TaxID=637954 RepID=A0AAV2JHX1_KNICA
MWVFVLGHALHRLSPPRACLRSAVRSLRPLGPRPGANRSPSLRHLSAEGRGCLAPLTLIHFTERHILLLKVASKPLKSHVTPSAQTQADDSLQTHGVSAVPPRPPGGVLLHVSAGAGLMGR